MLSRAQGLERSRRAREKALESHLESSTPDSITWIFSGLAIALLGAVGFWYRHRTAKS